MTQLAEQMNKKHHAFLDDKTFSIKAMLDGDGVYVCVTLTSPDESFVYPVEARLNCKEEEILPRKAALLLIDYADLYFEDFFAEGQELYLPIDWSGHEYDAVNFELKGQIKNLKVERMADDWLAKHDQDANGSLN